MGKYLREKLIKSETKELESIIDDNVEHHHPFSWNLHF